MEKVAFDIYYTDIQPGYRSYFLKLLKKLVTTETPPAHPAAHNKLYSILKKELEELDYKVQLLNGDKSGGQLYARPNTKQTHCFQLLLGHIDTVWPTGTLDKMPFKSEDNTLTGPGIYDMKAGIAMMLTALKVIYDHERYET
ncbi:MAG: M20/M25/M40 family metallo-hydrolase [Gracilimonas sp.]|nr:M20/M25/M40 family metallo-hydrolase [Gracilimonas sp.]